MLSKMLFQDAGARVTFPGMGRYLQLTTRFSILAFGATACAVTGSDEQSDRYWVGLENLQPSPSGNLVAVARHNCYAQGLGDSAKNLEVTLNMLHAAQAEGADLLELDVKAEDGVWRIGHDDDGSKTDALLSDVLADEALRVGEQGLLIELKENETASAGELSELLDILIKNGFAQSRRDVILRAFDARTANLTVLRELEVDSASRFRFHVLLGAGDPKTTSVRVAELADSGVDGVELNYLSADVTALLSQARAAGLATGIWTLGGESGTTSCARFRDEVDLMVTDGSIVDCKRAIGRVNDVPID